MRNYLINIDDSQRLALIKVLNSIDLKAVVDPVTGEHPLEFWVEMLNDLPAVEEKDPGIIHGFCL